MLIVMFVCLLVLYCFLWILKEKKDCLQFNIVINIFYFFFIVCQVVCDVICQCFFCRFGMVIVYEDIIVIFNKVKFFYNISKFVVVIVYKVLDNIYFMEVNVKSIFE